MKRCLCCAVLAVLVGASAASGETLSREERVIAYRLIGRLGDEDMDGQVCSEAITLLAQFGPKILPEIKRRLNTKDLVLRERLCAVLIQALNEDEPCPEAAPILRKQLVESLKRYATFAKSVSIHSVALEEAEKAAENAAKAAGESAPVRYYRVPTPGLRKPRRPADADNEVKKHMKRAEEHYEQMTKAMGKAAVCGRTIDLICGYFLHHAKPDDIEAFTKLSIRVADSAFMPSRPLAGALGMNVWDRIGRPWQVLRVLIAGSDSQRALEKCQSALIAEFAKLDKNLYGPWYARIVLREYRLTDHAIIRRLRHLKAKRQ